MNGMVKGVIETLLSKMNATEYTLPCPAARGDFIFG